jgi:hypothetical protein
VAKLACFRYNGGNTSNGQPENDREDDALLPSVIPLAGKLCLATLTARMDERLAGLIANAAAIVKTLKLRRRATVLAWHGEADRKHKEAWH